MHQISNWVVLGAISANVPLLNNISKRDDEELVMQGSHSIRSRETGGAKTQTSQPKILKNRKPTYP